MNKDFMEKILRNVDKIKNKLQKGESIDIEGGQYRVVEIDWSFEKISLGLIFKGETIEDISNSIINKKREFKIGDKVKLNRPLPSNIEKQLPYKKYYEVVMVDVLNEKVNLIAVDGMYGMIDSTYFDLY